MTPCPFSRILLFAVLVGTSVWSFNVLTIPLHETVHYVALSSFEPVSNVTFHLFDSFTIDRGHMACVSFDGRTVVLTYLQHEILAYGIQNMVVIILIYLIFKKEYIKLMSECKIVET